MDLKETTTTGSVCRSETSKSILALIGQREGERKREQKGFTLIGSVDV